MARSTNTDYLEPEEPSTMDRLRNWGKKIVDAIPNLSISVSSSSPRVNTDPSQGPVYQPAKDGDLGAAGRQRPDLSWSVSKFAQKLANRSDGVYNPYTGKKSSLAELARARSLNRMAAIAHHEGQANSRFAPTRHAVSVYSASEPMHQVRERMTDRMAIAIAGEGNEDVTRNFMEDARDNGAELQRATYAAWLNDERSGRKDAKYTLSTDRHASVARASASIDGLLRRLNPVEGLGPSRKRKPTVEVTEDMLALAANGDEKTTSAKLFDPDKDGELSLHINYSNGDFDAFDEVLSDGATEALINAGKVTRARGKGLRLVRFRVLGSKSGYTYRYLPVESSHYDTLKVGDTELRAKPKQVSANVSEALDGLIEALV